MNREKKEANTENVKVKELPCEQLELSSTETSEKSRACLTFNKYKSEDA